MNSVWFRTGLLVSCVKPSRRSISNHLLSSPGTGLVLFRSLPHDPSVVSHRGTMASIGLHHHSEVGHDNRPNRVRHPTDQRFTSSCSPPPLTRTQLLSVTTFRPNLARTFTSLIQHTYKRTSAATRRRLHSGSRPRPRSSSIAKPLDRAQGKR
jgi:hypothetical protein